MKKQITIPKNNLNESLGLNCTDKTKLNYFAWLGIVNHELYDKANVKEIVSVKIKSEYDGYVIKEWYEITYLESEMITSKDDLESAWEAGCEEGRKDEQAGGSSYNNLRQGNYFYKWFDEKFKNNEKTN